MKKLLIAAVLLSLSTPSLALDKEKMSHSKRGDIYFGLGAGEIDGDGFDDTARAVGATLGINMIHKPYGTFALDTFFSRTIDAATDRNDIETDVNIAGVFAAYRTPGKLYGKTRAGMVYSELDRSDSNDSDGSEFAWGAGLGAEVWFGVDLELEFLQVDSDVDAISLSLIFGE